MDYEEINGHMMEQQKSSLRAAVLQQMAGTTMTYDEINNCLSEQQKTSLMTAALQTMVEDASGVPQEYTNYDDVNNQLSEQQKSSLMAAALMYLKDNGGGGGGGGEIGIKREVSENGVYQTPSESFSFVLPSDVESIAPYALAYAFYNATGLTSADMSSVTSITGTSSLMSAFQGCTSLQSVNLESLKVISGTYAFSNAFKDCTSLNSVDFTSLEEISGAPFSGAFNGCTALSSLSFPSLSNLTNANNVFNRNVFSGCTSLKNIYFPALKSSSFAPYNSQFNGIVNGLDGCTLHFPAAIQAKIETMSGYPSFGGTNTIVLFDL